MSLYIIALILLASSATSVIASYLAITEKKLLNSILYLSLLSTSYTLIYYILMAPDVTLAYIPISMIILPLLLFTTMTKTTEGGTE